MAAKMFDEIAPKYAGRNGDYTRIVKLGARKVTALWKLFWNWFNLIPE